jgi:hypothetical protein
VNLNGKVERLEQRTGGRDYGPLMDRMDELMREAETERARGNPERAAELEREAVQLPIPIEVIDAYMGALSELIRRLERGG